MEFEHLDALTRRYMCEEIALDEERGAIYEDSRLRPGVFGMYVELLKQAAAWGTPVSLAEAIRDRRLLLATEQRARGGRVHRARVPRAAAAVLADMGFNRYYVRALCRRALDEERALEVCRARPAKRPRPESELRLGRRVDPRALLDDLRASSDQLGSALGIPAGPGSGLTVRLASGEA